VAAVPVTAHPELSPAGQAALDEGLPDLPPLSPASGLAQLAADAMQWRRLMASPHVAELLVAEYAEWQRRAAYRQAGSAISASRRTWVADTYTELQRRRFPPAGDVERWVRDGPPGHVEFAGRAAVAA